MFGPISASRAFLETPIARLFSEPRNKGVRFGLNGTAIIDSKWQMQPGTRSLCHADVNFAVRDLQLSTFDRMETSRRGSVEL